MENVDAVTPSSMKTYILGIQRSFKEWGYSFYLHNGRIFSCRKEGFKGFLDHLFWEQQAQGKTPKSHNLLTSEDLETLYKSHNLSRSYPTNFQCRQFFNIALVTAMRTT